MTIEKDNEMGLRVIDLIKNSDVNLDDDKGSILNFEFNNPLLRFVKKRKQHMSFLQNEDAVNLQNIYKVSGTLSALRVLILIGLLIIHLED